nr:unnamed protein product [Callosobruchus chinensis]
MEYTRGPYWGRYCFYYMSTIYSL